MITPKNETKLVGLSTDTKPINVENGTILFCMDENKYYIFDADGAEWHEYVEPNSGSGGSSLPDVTTDDNGDVLTVVEGAWAKAAPSGGGGVLVVHYDETDTGALDKTWQEIYDAFPAVAIYYTEEDGADYQAAFRFIVTTIQHDESLAPNSKYILIARDPSSGEMDEVRFEAATASDYPVVNDPNA